MRHRLSTFLVLLLLATIVLFFSPRKLVTDTGQRTGDRGEPESPAVTARQSSKPPLDQKASARALRDEICSRYTSLPTVNQIHRKPFADIFEAATPPIYQANNSARIRVLGIKDHDRHHPYMCNGLVYSAAMNDIPLELYGATTYFSGMMTGVEAKLGRLLPVLCAFDPSDVVLLVDAFDSVFMRPMEEIEYLYFHKWHSPNLVISTEGNCFPNEPEVCAPQNLPNIPPSSVKYINSGVIIAKVTAYIEIVAEAIDRWNRRGGYGAGDQHVLAEIVYEKYKKLGYFIDYSSELSASPHPPSSGFADISVDGRNYFVSLDSKSIPMLVHLNGGSSKDLVNPKERMWYFNEGKLKPELADKIQAYTVHVDGVAKTVAELCPL